jgi:hypothetical protein
VIASLSVLLITIVLSVKVSMELSRLLRGAYLLWKIPLEDMFSVKQVPILCEWRAYGDSCLVRREWRSLQNDEGSIFLVSLILNTPR